MGSRRVAADVGPSIIVVAVDARDHAVLARTLRGRPKEAFRLRRWPRDRPLKLELTGRNVRDVVIVAPRTTSQATAIAAWCAAVPDNVGILLVRWTDPRRERAWPDHPVNVVVDVPPERRLELLEVIDRVFLVMRPPWLPLLHAWSRMTLVRGDPRASACLKALRWRWREGLVLGLAGYPHLEQQPPLLAFLPRTDAPSATQTHPLVDEVLDVDPRHYVGVDPPDDPEEQAATICRLHAAHGDWRATLAAVEAFANGDLNDAVDLLDWLSVFLKERGPLTWAKLAAHAAAMGPPWTRKAHQGRRRAHSRSPGPARRARLRDVNEQNAYWSAVDATARHRPRCREPVRFDPEQEALAMSAREGGIQIAMLHIAHGDWRATVAAVAACATGNPQDGIDLLDALGQVLDEDAPLSWDALGARAKAMGSAATTISLAGLPPWVTRPPGYKRGKAMYRARGRRAFWRWVDEMAGTPRARDQLETEFYLRSPVAQDLMIARGDDATRVGLSEASLRPSHRRAMLQSGA